VDQSEVWGSFRVGRRARPRVLNWLKSDQYTVLRAEHDGYCRDGLDVVHRRTVLGADGYWLVQDELIGSGAVRAASYVHLHPSLSAELREGVWFVEGTDELVCLMAFGVAASRMARGETDPLLGWYSERFGEKQPNATLVFEVCAAAPKIFGYIIARPPSVEPEAGMANRLEDARALLRALVTDRDALDQRR